MKKAHVKGENVFHKALIAPMLRLMDKMSGRKLPAAPKKRGRYERPA
jgi:hypothetical protein